MSDVIDCESARKLINALDQGQLDYLFQTAHVNYAERDSLTGTSLALGLPHDSVTNLVAAIRRAQGLTILAGAWGDYAAWITISAGMVELLHDIDIRSNFDFHANTELPDDEIRALQNRILIEEVLPIGLTLGELSPTDDIGLTQARNGARRMLMEGTEPTTDYERWVLRFFTLMNRLPELAEEPLTVHRMQELHAMLALDKETGGVFRTSDAIAQPGIGLSADGSGTPAARIMSEMSAIAAYGTGSQKPYVHPMIKTIVYFYWIRRIQPFEVANALFARLVIHIYEYQQGYKTLPLTPLTRTAASEWAVPPPSPTQGPRVDATTFVIKRLQLFLNAYAEAERELAEATKRYRALCSRFEGLDINHRQARILDEALSLPTTVFTIKRHARSRGLAYETARQDFLQLVSAGYFEQYKRGRLFEFRLAQDAEKKLNRRLGQ
jgi:Fic family protein